MADGRRVAREHGCGRIQARRPGPDLSQVRLDAFEEQHGKLEPERAEGADAEDADEYRAANIFWVPKMARWSHIKGNASQPTVGKLVRLFHGFDWSRWVTGTPQERVGLLPSGQEHVLKQQDGKDRLVGAVRELSQASSLAVPHEEALRIRDDVAFFHRAGRNLL